MRSVLLLAGLLASLLAGTARSSDDGYPTTVYTPIHTNVSLVCGLPFPDTEDVQLVVWKQNQFWLAGVSEDGSIKFSGTATPGKYSITGVSSKSYVLNILDVTTEDTANYTCQKDVKRNEGGKITLASDMKVTELIVQDVPSEPGMPVIEELWSRKVNVSWAPSLRDNDSPITNYIVNVKTISQTWAESRVILVSDKTTHILLRELFPSTPYQIRVIAKNAIGNSTPSTPSNIFITKPEVPSERPQNLQALSMKSTRIEVMWDPPPDTAWNGDALGYAVQYKETASDTIFPIDVHDKTRTDLVIEGVKAFTNYTISIQAKNEVGTGPPAVINIRTAEGVPSSPRVTHYSHSKPTSFIIYWKAPEQENGILREYQLQWIHNSTYKTRIITGLLTNPMSALITGLKPYTFYNVKVRACTGGGYSKYSNTFSALTDVAGPGPPVILNVTVVGPTSIYIQWKKPEVFYWKISSYMIQYWTTPTSKTYATRTERMVRGDITETYLTDLPTNNDYTVKIAAVTQSYFSDDDYVGNFSTALSFRLEDPNARRSQTEVVSAGAVAGIVVGAIIVIVMVILLAGYRSVKCRRYYLSALRYIAVPTNSNTPPNTVIFPTESIEVTKYPEIKVSDFLQHVRNLHADSDVGFAQEFDDITSHTRTDFLSEASCSPENKAKNRYINISAFDHSRVQLQPLPGKPRSSDFINANYIDGYKKPGAYIATQGPLPHTFADFWRMVWEQGSIVIVMITNLVERGRHKCDKYWPEEGTETYGCVAVKHINTFSRAHYTVRMFSLKSSKIKKKHVSERIVYQYHYTEWPDHGVPEFTLPVLTFTQKSAGINPPGAGPIVVHCSAGVGRTGTYILIDTMIQQIRDRGTVNIPTFLLHIRKQRNFLVQTEEQYMLIHDALAEYLLTQGDTEIKDYDISRYTGALVKQINGEPIPLDIQYSLATEFVPRQDDMFHAYKPVNQYKNRIMDYVPISVKRVMLPVRPGVDGSDYINATYLQGFNKSNEFIVTQHPLESTVEDFWRMIWDQNSSVVVMLSSVDEKDYQNFWPEQNKQTEYDTGNFKLTYREDDERKKYLIREFLLESTQDDYNLMTRVVSPKTAWPESCDPLHTVFDLVETVQTLHKQNDIGPIIVVDRFGGVEAATFCALTSIFDQLQLDRAVNVYQLAKLYNLKRPGAVGTKENYLFLYKAAESLSKEWSDRQSSPASVRLNLGSMKKNGTLPRSVTINSKIETNV